VADAVKRKPLISANWKMNLNHFEAIQTMQKLTWALKPEDYRAADVCVHPPFTDIRSVQTLLEADSIPIALGAQNCHSDDAGAFTGEISPIFLQKLNVAYIIVGHSERRAVFNESNEFIAAKVAAVFKHGMTPILCAGETIHERERGAAEDVVTTQLVEGLANVKKDDVKKLVVAYEPSWAIGTGQVCPPDLAQGMCKMIRGILADKFGAAIADSVRIQYGGSVKPANAADLLGQADIDGALVGGASLDPDEFARIVAAAHA
jgi:triosephosphate isomerase (TIM)